MSEDVLGYLNKKGIVTKRASAVEVNMACFFCGEPEGKRGRLYVNVNPDAEIPGLYSCKLCNAHGSLVSIRKHFGDVSDKQEREDTSYKRRAIFAFAADYYHDALDRHVDVLRYLTEERGLTVATIDAHNIGYAAGGNDLFRLLRKQGYSHEEITAAGLVRHEAETGRAMDFLNDHIVIPYHVAGNVVMLRGRAFGPTDDGRKYVTGPGQKARLFNTDAVWGAKEILICEGELDCLVVAQLGYAAVAVPGANTWQDTWDDYFADAQRAWIVFDRDLSDTGGKAAAKLLERIGPRARKVELPEHEKGKSKNDLTEWVVNLGHTRDDLDELLHATTGALVSVPEAIAAHAALMSMPGLKLGMTLMDKYIAPGLLPSQVMVILANTGAGKTILLLNLFYRILTDRQDAKILFVSLEQTSAEWWERARRIYRFFHLGETDADAEAFYKGRIFIDDRNRVTPDDLHQLLVDFEYEAGKRPDLVAVDYLGYWAQSFKGERYERTSDAIMTMKAIAKAEQVRFITPHQVSRSTMHGSEPGVDGGRDSGVVEETADFVLSLWRTDTTSGTEADTHDGIMHLKLNKSRHGSTGHMEKFQFAELCLAVVNQDNSASERFAKDELTYNKSNQDWETALLRHRVGLGPHASLDKVEKQWKLKQQAAQDLIDARMHQKLMLP